jgi:SAM-dependent methyltransferase
VAEFGGQTFGAHVFVGPIESQIFAPASFDVLVLNDILEHLPDPVATLQHCVRLLKPGGFFVIQTPEYKEHLTYADLRASNDLFLKHMDQNNEVHLFLYSRRSAGLFFERLGFPCLVFDSPVYAYDLYFTASRTPLPRYNDQEIAAALMPQPVGRLVLALLDKAYESNDRWWAMQRLEAELKSRPLSG